MVREGREGEERGKAHGWQKERYDVLKIQNDRTLGIKNYTYKNSQLQFCTVKRKQKSLHAVKYFTPQGTYVYMNCPYANGCVVVGSHVGK